MNQHLNRRKVFASAAAAAGAVVALDQASANATGTPEERPLEKVHRLAGELSKAMDGWMEDIGGDYDAFVAEIWSAKSGKGLGFRHNLGGWTPDEKILELEAAFHSEWAKLRALEPELNAAELRYYDLKVKPPVMGEMTPEEDDRLRNTTVADLAKLPPSRASVEYTEALRAYEKADAAARRKSGYGKLDRAYAKQMHITGESADAVFRHPAKSIAGMAAKERVHRVWEFDDFSYIMKDIVNIGGDPALIPTGRGSYVPAGSISLAELLRRYDMAPDHTMSREVKAA
ncbi:hypothetical protein EOB59_03460 [Mesorhizobium sp. M7A.F.Ca.MR.176.00.0.0]|uniref:hypothetical protein n=1 Tax=Mesorhizobium sp. M7A.F.Ca.MR.176.00.0.0 TaxID=2496776 RepID=UPI000FD59750|nr:hypothetical protein [Mesorhizobium sp. M7A.F.Ca.MR.176.00.0.0]RUU93370.1 hypothetical protein EOB59_03460 [Mesorhizobium sp. M7A.F.Ca.MR.176.00.0.0]